MAVVENSCIAPYEVDAAAFGLEPRSAARRHRWVFVAAIAFVLAWPTAMWLRSEQALRSFTVTPVGAYFWDAQPSAPSSSPTETAPDFTFLKVSRDAAVAANAAIPVARERNPPSTPFYFQDSAAEGAAAAQNCLSQAVYYESASEPRAGQEAVAQVVLNRVRTLGYPKTVCGVVYQGSNLRTGCQFTFTCDGSLARSPQGAAWRTAQDVAEAAMNGFVMTTVGGATHYHTMWVTPRWSAELAKIGQIGAHIFYRWSGQVMVGASAARAMARVPGDAGPDGRQKTPHGVALNEVAAVSLTSPSEPSRLELSSKLPDVVVQPASTRPSPAPQHLAMPGDW